MALPERERMSWANPDPLLWITTIGGEGVSLNYKGKNIHINTHTFTQGSEWGLKTACRICYGVRKMGPSVLLSGTWSRVSSFTSQNLCCIIHEIRIPHLCRISGRLSGTALKWLTSSLACWQGLGKYGVPSPLLEFANLYGDCYGNHMAWVCICLGTFANAFHPNSCFYHMNSRMWASLMHVYMPC